MMESIRQRAGPESMIAAQGQSAQGRLTVPDPQPVHFCYQLRNRANQARVWSVRNDAVTSGRRGTALRVYGHPAIASQFSRSLGDYLLPVGHGPGPAQGRPGVSPSPAPRVSVAAACLHVRLGDCPGRESVSGGGLGKDRRGAMSDFGKLAVADTAGPLPEFAEPERELGKRAADRVNLLLGPCHRR
jgi:hypothetical protein